MTEQSWIILPKAGYCFGVEAQGKGRAYAELHGGFSTVVEAERKKRELLSEFSDYASVKVVRIETPQVSS